MIICQCDCECYNFFYALVYEVSEKQFCDLFIFQNFLYQAYSNELFNIHRIKREMPAGRSFICMDTKELPQIMKTIFESSVLK